MTTFCAVKRHSKVILVVLAVLLAIVGIALLGAKTYVESTSTRNRIEAQLGRVLGLPLAISEVSLWPWSGLKISGVSVPGDDGNFLEGATFRARCRFVPLLQRRLEIYGLRAENPRIVWREGADGKWTLPQRVKATADEPNELSEAPKEGGSKEKKSEGFQVTVDGLKIANAAIELLNKEKKSVVKLVGVNIDYGVLTPERVEGTLRIDRVQWSALAITQVQAPFKYTPDAVTLTPLEGTVAGGALKGSLSLQPKVQGIPFNADLKLTAADVGKLMNETGWAPNQFFGRIDGFVEMHGTVRRLVKVEGKGALSLRGAEIKGFEFFKTISEGLHIPELADLRLGDSSTEIRLGDEKVFIDSLALNSPAVKVLASGLVRLNGRITVDARLALAEGTIRQLPDFVREFVANVNGENGIDFKVGGTLSKPKTDLLDKVSGKRALSQAVDVVGNLFGDRKKKDDKKKEKKTETAKATPPPLPALDPTATTVVPPADAPPTLPTLPTPPAPPASEPPLP